MEWLGIDRRRLGTGLLAFGIVGVVLAAVIAVALAGGAIAARNLDDRLAADQARIAASLTRLTLTMDGLAVTLDNASETLDTSQAAVVHAGGALGDLAVVTDGLATSIDVSILGSRPFASASERLAEIARTMLVFQQDAQALAVNLDRNTGDVATMADEIRTLKGQVSELAATVANFDRIDEIVGLLIGGIVLGALLTAWVAAAAGLCAWVGWRLRRASPASPAEPAAPVEPAA